MKEQEPAQLGKFKGKKKKIPVWATLTVKTRCFECHPGERGTCRGGWSERRDREQSPSIEPLLTGRESKTWVGISKTHLRHESFVTSRTVTFLTLSLL